MSTHFLISIWNSISWLSCKSKIHYWNHRRSHLSIWERRLLFNASSTVGVDKLEHFNRLPCSVKYYTHWMNAYIYARVLDLGEALNNFWWFPSWPSHGNTLKSTEICQIEVHKKYNFWVSYMWRWRIYVLSLSDFPALLDLSMGGWD